MGYRMSQMEAEFRIPKDRFADALAAIQALAGKETIHDRSGLHFSWVATEDFVRARTLEEALRAWRWNPDLDADGNIDGIWFEGEKSGDDTLLFEAIAPFVAPGSYIQMIGEDDSIWRWRFDGRHAHEEPARLVFGDAPGDPEAR
jgi:hypothetical protein